VIIFGTIHANTSLVMAIIKELVMFILLAILLSLAIVGSIYCSSQKRKTRFQQKYELVSNLRNLISLCRQHRSTTHCVLYRGDSNNQKIEQIETNILTICEELINKAHFDNRPIYRILQSKLKKLIDDWENTEISQNQMAHGRSIRHCLFLIDDIILSWLVESQQIELGDKYNVNWQQILDSLDALTQLRIAIQDTSTKNKLARLQLYANCMNRRLNQLAILNPLAVSSPTCSLVCQQLEEISTSDELHFTREQLYDISTEASLVIFNSYDFILSDITETIYEPLPTLILSKP